MTSTLPDRSNRLRKTVLAWEWLYSPDALGHHAVQRSGRERQLHIEIHFHPDPAGERVDMEELDGFGDGLGGGDHLRTGQARRGDDRL